MDLEEKLGMLFGWFMVSIIGLAIVGILALVAYVALGETACLIATAIGFGGWATVATILLLLLLRDLK